MSNTTTPAQYILILIDMVESQDCTRKSLLAGTTLAKSGISGIGARINDEDFNKLVANAQALTGDPALGLKLGMRLHLSAHAILGQAFMTCRDLAQVMDLLLKYHHLLASRLQLELETIGEQCVLTLVSTPSDVSVEFGYELLYGAFINTLRGLLNAPDLCLRMELPYPEPAHSSFYYETLGKEVYFNCVRGRILFHRDQLDTPVPSSNPVLRNLYEAECARLLADLEEESSVAEQTLRLLRKLEGQYPQMPQIANMLNLSPRTYRRRLDEEQQSFQQLLDQVRGEHATRYLQNTRLPLSSVAYKVGFSDPSNFRRAYLKWTGMTPGEIRRG
ncbi:MAG: AraC family transcriptional regulator [Halioglobus sp.]|jgi:AraC-like DNA-binding protein|tara:strand:- start:147 stop:1142 length:996 start_codon:yes stop_codon:yes gene_type:complete